MTDTAVDPVCGRPVVPYDARLSEEYADNTYYFCSQECLDRFTEQPDVFVAQPGSGDLAQRDRGKRTDDHRGELHAGQPAELTNSPPTPGPG